jgi:hypothetical protein
MSFKQINPVSNVSYTVNGNFVPITPALTSFRKKYPGWLEEWEKAGALYRLPIKTIRALQKPPEGRSPVMDDRNCEIETAFTDLCDQTNAIGYWNGGFINVHYLRSKKSLSISPAQRDLLNWTPTQVIQAERLSQRGDSISARLKGVAGWLITDPEFIRARDDQASRWGKLPADSRPLMISRSLKLSARPQSDSESPEEVIQFQEDLNAFLDKWGLMQMLTWDLPAPQGPLLPATSSVSDAPSIPKHGIHLVLPLHYPLTGNDDLLHHIR